MKEKDKKIKIVYEDIEVVEYHFVNEQRYDDFEPKNRFIYSFCKASN